MARKNSGKRASTSSGSSGTSRSSASAKPSGRSTTPAHHGQAVSKSGKQKVGANPKAAQRVGGKGDFGIPAIEARDIARETGRPVGAEQPGRSPRSSGEGQRVTGVGGPASGPGSSSGGDLDPDIIGVGTGSGLAESAPGEVTLGPASTTGGSEEFASGPPARGEGNLGPGRRPAKVSGSVKGTTHDRSTSPANTGFSGADEEETAMRTPKEAKHDHARDRRRDTR